MASQYKTKEFKKLKQTWYNHLFESGFEDLEDKHENLKAKDRRTIAWKNQDRIMEFFFTLDEYLITNKKIPIRDRKILELWTQGIYQVKIAEITQVPLITVKKVIRRYKQILFPHI